MTRRLLRASLLALFATACHQSAVRPAAPEMTADELVAKILEVRKETGFRIRATLTRSTPGSDAKDVRHLLITGHRSQGHAALLYQQLWPAVAEGRAVVIEDTGDHRLGGFLYESNKVTPLTDRMMGVRLFDSDLLIEDLAEGFWHWPSRQVAGEEAVGEHPCVIVELRPGPSTPTTYSLVKTWLSPDLSIGLRAELFGPDGRLVKQIGLYRLLKFDDRWMPAILTVEPTDRRSRTVVEGVKLDRNVAVSPADFTVAAIRKNMRRLED